MLFEDSYIYNSIQIERNKTAPIVTKFENYDIMTYQIYLILQKKKDFFLKSDKCDKLWSHSSQFFCIFRNSLNHRQTLE